MSRVRPPANGVDAAGTRLGGWCDNTIVFLGAEAYKSLGDSAQPPGIATGFMDSAGFSGGFNTGVRLFDDSPIRGQIGGSYGVYDLKGRDTVSPSSAEQQTFLTAGIYKRSDILDGDAISWGLVYDQFWAHPLTPSANDQTPIEVGVQFQTLVSGYIEGIRFYKGDNNTGTHVGYLWTANGTLLASATFTDESTNGWQEVDFSTPVAVTAGTTYVASYYAPNGGYAVSPGDFMFEGAQNGPLVTLGDKAATGGNGVFRNATGGGFPTQTSNADNYWVDVVFSATQSKAGPVVASESPAPGASTVPTTASVTATFNESVQSSSIQFTLTDSNGNVVAGTMNYTDSNHTATFTPIPTLVSGMTYTASVGGALDATGDVMIHPFTWSFFTAGPVTNATIWSPTTTPLNSTWDDSNAVELGLKFQASQDGTVTGVRFYKGSGNGGAHVGQLWTAGGTLLASVTFTNETTFGWQQATFSSPVAISANATYIVSYFAPGVVMRLTAVTSRISVSIRACSMLFPTVLRTGTAFIFIPLRPPSRPTVLTPATTG